MKRKLLLNSFFSVLLQIITIVCGLILPRLIIKQYGSEINGLISSITQFLSIISLLQLGVGAVAQSSWYKPLAEKNYKKISEVYTATQSFFRKISMVLLVYILSLCIVYPFIINESVDHLFTITLILSISINIFLQYLLGITNQLLLYSDQKAYVYMIIQSLLLIVNTIISVILIKSEADIRIVKLLSSLIFSLSPVILSIYVKNNYEIDLKTPHHKNTLAQKRNGFAQHIASVIMDNTDVAVLTIFSSLKDVSVYYVYHMVVFGVRQLIASTGVGVQSALGSLIARKKDDDTVRFFNRIEFLYHFLVTFVFSCVIVMLPLFVKVYTNGVNDVNYIVPGFSLLIAIAFALYCYRIPYNTIIKAAGKYKETQKSAIVEAVLNIVVSVSLVINFGLVGVAIGTIAATMYRYLSFVSFLRNNIINLKVSHFLRITLCDIIAICLIVLFSRFIVSNCDNYVDLLFNSVRVSALAIIVMIFVYLLFERKQMFSIVRRFLMKIHKK